MKTEKKVKMLVVSKIWVRNKSDIKENKGKWQVKERTTMQNECLTPLFESLNKNYNKGELSYVLRCWFLWPCF